MMRNQNQTTEEINDIDFTMANLASLEPQAQADRPSVNLAHQRFTQAQNQATFQTGARQRTNQMNKTNRKWTLGTIFAVLALIITFSFPAPRALASDFLGIFRVDKFAAISVSPQQLETIGSMLDEGVYPGEFTAITEPSDPQAFDSFKDAKDYIYKTDVFNGWGFTTLDSENLGMPNEILLSDGGTGKLTVDLDSSREILSAVDVDPLLLSESLDGADIHVEMYSSLTQSWDGVEYTQMPSPSIDYPSDVDSTLIGSAILQLLGMEEKEASRLSQNIDWTNTLLMPVPAEFGTFSEVRLGDTTGLAIENIDGEGATLMYERNGIVHLLMGYDTYDSIDALIKLASQ